MSRLSMDHIQTITGDEVLYSVAGVWGFMSRDCADAEIALSWVVTRSHHTLLLLG